MIAPPILQAFVLADQFYTDAATGKRIIAGTFTRILTTRIPSKHPPCYAFVVLTEFVGEAPLQIRFVRLRDNRIIMESGKIQISCEDPITVLDLAIAIPEIPFKEEGAHAFECYVDDTLIGTVRLQIRLHQQDGEQA